MSQPTDLRYRILDIVTNNIVSDSAQNRFESDFKASFSASDRLKDNYSTAEMDLSGHVMFSALYDSDDRFVACSGIYRREKWPQGSYRLLNRTYYNPLFRNTHRFQFFGSDYILPHQLRTCDVRIDFSFVSREGPHAGLFMQKLAKRAVFAGYKVSDAYVQVVPDVYNPQSFQKLLYRNHTEAKGFDFLGCDNLDDLQQKRFKPVRL